MKYFKPTKAKMIIVVCIICTVGLSVPITIAEDQKQCVAPDKAIEAWENAINMIELPRIGVMNVHPVCDPCSCGNDMASCYEYMAAQERSRNQRYGDITNLLNRAKVHGICR